MRHLFWYRNSAWADVRQHQHTIQPMSVQTESESEANTNCGRIQLQLTLLSWMFETVQGDWTLIVEAKTFYLTGTRTPTPCWPAGSYANCSTAVLNMRGFHASAQRIPEVLCSEMKEKRGIHGLTNQDRRPAEHWRGNFNFKIFLKINVYLLNIKALKTYRLNVLTRATNIAGPHLVRYTILWFQNVCWK
jgi:hypothetical protein